MPARHVGQAHAVRLDDAPAGAAQAGVDADDANRVVRMALIARIGGDIMDAVACHARGFPQHAAHGRVLGHGAEMGAKFWLMASGTALILIGVLIRWKTSRYDLKDAARSIQPGPWRAASARPKTRPRSKPSSTRSGRSRRGPARQPVQRAHVAGHFAAQVLGVVALVLMLAGLALATFGFFRG